VVFLNFVQSEQLEQTSRSNMYVVRYSIQISFQEPSILTQVSVGSFSESIKKWNGDFPFITS
jgi:hypothetical protein